MRSGRSGSEIPARARRTASDTAATAVVLADHATAELLLHPQQLRGLALEQPARGDAGPRADHFGDVVRADLLAHHRRAVVGLGADLGQLRSPAAAARRRGSGRPSRSRPRAGPSRRSSAARRSGSSARRRGPGPPSPAPSARGGRPASPPCRRGRRAASRAGATLASSVSLASASSSIRSRSTCRCSWSISTGEESISIRSRDAASSTRSIALSGRNRLVM